MTNDTSATPYLDTGAVAVYVASFANVLPAVAAGLSIIWFTLRILETRTVQSILARWGWNWVVRNKGDTSED